MARNLDIKVKIEASGGARPGRKRGKWGIFPFFDLAVVHRSVFKKSVYKTRRYISDVCFQVNKYRSKQCIKTNKQPLFIGRLFYKHPRTGPQKLLNFFPNLKLCLKYHGFLYVC